MARRVLVNGLFVDKPGTTVAEEDQIAVQELEHPYVSRGGLKLQRALGQFGIDLHGKVCADIGASTGGFTDVMLRAGAARVYAIDVGYGQLDASLRNHPRVVLRERLNARNLRREDVEEPAAFAAIDVSFISLRLILPAVVNILAEQGEMVALIKPQFEVGRGEVGKGGIVRDAEKRQIAVNSILEFARSIGLSREGLIESPIKGVEGNVEFLAHLHRGTDAILPSRTAGSHP